MGIFVVFGKMFYEFLVVAFGKVNLFRWNQWHKICVTFRQMKVKIVNCLESSVTVQTCNRACTLTISQMFTIFVKAVL